MSRWALLSGVQGNLAAYEAVLSDIKRQHCPVEALFILGDLVGPTADCEALVERVRDPKPGEPEPQICQGWWEEQCLILHGLGQTGDPVELRQQVGAEGIAKLWQAVSRSTVRWLRSLDFGFMELDCLLIHGSTVSVSDRLTPESPPLTLWDRVVRGEANRLFCGRSGLAFRYELSGSVKEQLQTLEGNQNLSPPLLQSRQVIGVGSVGGMSGRSTYTLYDPGTDQIQFKDIGRST